MKTSRPWNALRITDPLWKEYASPMDSPRKGSVMLRFGDLFIISQEKYIIALTVILVNKRHINKALSKMCWNVQLWWYDFC